MRQETIPVALFGASGYTGREAARLLGAHPAFRLAAAFSGPDRAELPLSTLHPSLRGQTDIRCEPLDLARRRDAVAASLPDRGILHALLATPETTSMALAPALLERGLRVVDLSGAFRLRHPAAYAAWYGGEHAAPGLLGRAAYGLSEWTDGALSAASLTANPGCYPTAALLALLPLQRAGLIDSGSSVIINAISGASGAGRRLREDLMFCEVEGSIRPYGVPRHRHLGEITEQCRLDPAVEVVFVPHLAPIERGLLCSIALRLRPGAGASSLADAYAGAYRDAPFIRLLGDDRLPSTAEVRGGNSCAIGWAVPRGSRQALVFSAIDNLIKGASGQAVQNLNMMTGRPESEGLPA